MQYADSHVPGPSFRFTMVNWSDPAEITKDAGQWGSLAIIIAGPYFSNRGLSKGHLYTLRGLLLGTVHDLGF